MEFMLRRPFALASSIVKQAPRASQTTLRSFQTHAAAPTKQVFSKPTTPRRPAFTSNQQNAFRQASRRSYQTPAAPANPLAQGNLTQRLLYGGAIFGGTLLAVNLIFNRETRDDGGMPAFERAYLNETFLHTGLGIGIIGLTARQMVQSGFVYRLMVTNPWVVAIGGLALSFGTMIGTRSIEPDK